MSPAPIAMAGDDRVRLDLALVARGLCASRSRARDLVLRGKVLVDGAPADKPGQTVTAAAELTVDAAADPYASRAGLKLAHALDRFAIDPAGRIALDVGASTGGFTDVLLRRGATRVYAVDVGHGQLAAGLRADPRVVLHERCNARDLSREIVPEPPQIIVCDVSFISLKVALPAALGLAAPGAALVALVKPQFEVGRAHLGKSGVVRDAAVRRAAAADIAAWLAGEGWPVLGIEDSPVAGGDGNEEFLIGARRGP